MRRPLPALLLVGALLASAASACGKADAAASASAGSASAAKAGAPAPSPLTATAKSAGDGPSGVAGDTLSDSALIARADRGRLKGRDGAPIWVVMISDFQCPYCKSFHDSSMARIDRDYVQSGKVRFAYLHFPLGQHPHARSEAEASMCAGVQDKFWPFTEALFAKQAEVAKVPDVEPVLTGVAKQLGLDLPTFGACRKRGAIKALVESDAQQASKSGIKSTPSFLVGSFLVEGAIPYADFRKAIDTALIVAQQQAKAKGGR